MLMMVVMMMTLVITMPIITIMVMMMVMMITIIMIRLSITPGTPVDESADEDVSLLCAPQPPDETLLEVVVIMVMMMTMTTRMLMAMMTIMMTTELIFLIMMTMTMMMTLGSTQVKWYLDGILLRKLPDCSNGTERCNMVSSIIIFSRPLTYHNYHHQYDQDPSKVILESVRRIFHGNYSCQVSMLP